MLIESPDPKKSRKPYTPGPKHPIQNPNLKTPNHHKMKKIEKKDKRITLGKYLEVSGNINDLCMNATDKMSLLETPIQKMLSPALGVPTGYQYCQYDE